MRDRCGSRRSIRSAPSLLRREAPAIGLSRDFVIYDSSDQQAAIKQILKELNIDDKLIPPRAALSRISHAQNRMEGPESFRRRRNLHDEQLAKVFTQYVEVLRSSNALDFDDLLLRRWSCSRAPSRSARRYATSSSYVMVDEYQDTNRPQYLLITPRSPPIIAISPSSAIRTSRSTSGAARTCATSSTSSSDFPEAAS